MRRAVMDSGFRPVPGAEGIFAMWTDGRQKDFEDNVQRAAARRGAHQVERNEKSCLEDIEKSGRTVSFYDPEVFPCEKECI